MPGPAMTRSWCCGATRIPPSRLCRRRDGSGTRCSSKLAATRPVMSLHQKAKDLFLAALEQTPEDRAPFLASACGDDAALRAEIDSLLAFHEEDNPTNAATTN